MPQAHQFDVILSVRGVVYYYKITNLVDDAIPAYRNTQLMSQLLEIPGVDVAEGHVSPRNVYIHADPQDAIQKRGLFDMVRAEFDSHHYRLDQVHP